jgi:hypothetical protein
MRQDFQRATRARLTFAASRAKKAASKPPWRGKTMLRPILSCVAIGAVALAAAPVAGKDKSPLPKELPPVFEAVVNCRALTSDSERLACYDRSVAALAAAREKEDIVVADRATIRETKKGLFGFTVPKLKLFGGTESEDVEEIETTILTVRTGPDGLAVLTLADGARWRQTDGADQFARPGLKIRIRRGALGSYLASIDAGSYVRVVRLSQ